MKTIVYKGELIFVRLLIPVVLGIITAFYFPTIQLLALSLGGSFGSLVVLTVLWLAFKPLKLYFNRWLAGIVVNLLLFSLALFITLHNTERIKYSYFGEIQARAFVVRVSSEPRLSNGIMRFEAQVNQAVQPQSVVPVTGKLLVTLKAEQRFNLRYGDEILIPNRLSNIDPPYNPFEFDYKRYLSNLGIDKQAFISSNQIKLLGREKGNLLISYALKLRRQLVEGFTKYIRDKEAAALASTLILGYKAELSPEIITAYSKTGTMHVLSVSGMHVLLVFSIFAFLLSFLDKSAGLKLFKVVLIIAAVWFYALLTGFSSAVCRAAVMCSIYVIGKTFNRKTNSYNTLAASALLLLLYNPYFLVDAGFQLSYLAVLGLVYLYPKIRHLVYIKNKIGDSIWSWTAVSIAAQLATLPLSLYYFHQFPLYFIISNLFIIVPVELIMYTGIGFLVLFSCKEFVPGFVLECVGKVLNFSIYWMNKGLICIENLSYSSLSFYPYSAFYYLCLFLAAVVFIYALQFRKKKYLFFSLTAFVGLAIFTSFEQIQRNNEQQIIFYSLRKNRAVSFIEGKNCFLFSNLLPTEKTFSFSVQPSLSAFGGTVSNITSSKPAGIILDEHFLQFKGWRMMIWDKYWKNKLFARPIEVNAVLLSDNPKVELKRLKEAVKFSVLLIDATNKDYRIKQWEQQAKDLGIKYYVLKRNPALEINLKS